MKQSQLFPKTIKVAPRDAKSVNHQLLVRGGFVDQLMAGSWTLLPLGMRVLAKINNIIRDEMNKIGAQEILMPLLHPKDIWNETGRWESAKEVMYQFDDDRKKEYALSFTHEEILLDLVRKHVNSYQDLPKALYHFSTKFRNEPRARSGILRGREFLMKDLYSVHATEEDFWHYYEEVKKAYIKIFKRIGLSALVVEAAGGVFTDNNTHEFQVLAEGGEDLIYHCDKCEWAQNKEIYEAKKENICPKCKSGNIIEDKAIEVGNIFPFGTYYSEKMNASFTDKNGDKKYMYFGSYGIGTTRLIGACVETSHDEKGIVWNEAVSPFSVHLIDLPGGIGSQTYDKLTDAGIEVLLDDREKQAGEKFADADLIGITNRVVSSEKLGEKFEVKKRSESETKTLTFDELLKYLQ